MTDIDAIAGEAFAALGTGGHIPPFSQNYPALNTADAYRVTARIRTMREARGERPVGRKVGFTNRTIWHEYDVYEPMWSYVYDSTLHELTALPDGFPLSSLSEPRIEPEIVFGIATPPNAAMGDRALLGCIAWVAHGFEIVQSIFPGWKFAAADTVAAYGLHGALLIGPRHPVGTDVDGWLSRLTGFEIDLSRNGVHADHGRALNVMEGPVSSIRYMLQLLEKYPVNPPLAAGEIVTTGTLTRALPIFPGETWSTKLTGIDLEPAVIRFT
jgi:2-oxo-3-hexenedioate decarboxylase